MRLVWNSLRCSGFALALCLGLLGTCELQAQEWAKAQLEASPRHLEYGVIKHGDRSFDCFIAYPEVAEKAHVVVLIHDISGFGDWIKSVADQVAEAGYIAVVPDLASDESAQPGAEPPAVDAIRRAVAKLPPERVKADLDATVAFARKLPAAKGSVSVGGFCWGGGQTLRYATQNPEIQAAFVFYGHEPIEASGVATVDFPVYGFYAQNDARINASLPEVLELFKAADKPFEHVIYDGAGHGFMRQGQDPSSSEANKQARHDAWQRWKDLLKSL